jgi:hypothetical protein
MGRPMALYYVEKVENQQVRGVKEVWMPLRGGRLRGMPGAVPFRPGVRARRSAPECVGRRGTPGVRMRHAGVGG